MVNVRIGASYCQMIALKALIKRDFSVKNVGRTKIHPKDKLDSGRTSEEGRYCSSRRPEIPKLQSRESVERKPNYSIRHSRYYSNVEEKNANVKNDQTGTGDWGGPEVEKLIIKLEKDIVDSIKAYESLLVFFYTSWCKHCKNLKPVYGAAAAKMKEENVNGHLAAIDVTKRMDVADKFNIVSVPMIYYFRKGEFIQPYGGKRTAEDIVNFMKNPPSKPLLLSKIDI